MTARGTSRPRDLKKGPAMTVPRTNTGRERAGSEAEPDRRPVTAAAGGHARRAALPGGGRFWLAAWGLFLFLFGAGGPPAAVRRVPRPGGVLAPPPARP